MPTEPEAPALDEKEQEIIAVGASVASGCLPCTKFHHRAAAQVGADEGEILQAAEDATRVRMAATEIMARAAGLPPMEAQLPLNDAATPRTLIRELVAISAAYAVNCSTSLESHAAAARALGATDRQVFAAIQIACAIKDVASRKVRGAAGAVLGVSEEQAIGCDCADLDAPAADGIGGCAPNTERGPGGCSCGTDDGAAAKRKERVR